MLATALSALAGVRIRQQLIGVLTGVVDHLAEDHGPSRSERSAGPPEVEGGRVAVADALLPRRRRVDRVEWERDLNELSSGSYLGHLGSHRHQPRAPCTGAKRSGAPTSAERVTDPVPLTLTPVFSS